MLKGRRAIVTGSTTGIGQGIANALAAAGCAVMLNGFGEAAEIEAQRADMIRRYGVEVLYNGADLAKPKIANNLCATRRSGWVVWTFWSTMRESSTLRPSRTFL